MPLVCMRGGQLNRRLLVGFLLLLCCTGFFASPVFAQTPTPPAEQPFQPIVPELGVPIPGLEFTPATREGDKVVVAYFAEYVNAGYRYLVGVILMVSIIMVVYGGFRYLLGSADVGNITRAKEIIRDAIAGMLLVIGAFLILQTVNPATTDLRALQLSSVARQDVDWQLTTTDAVTGVTTGEMDEMRRESNAMLEQEEAGAGSAPPAPSSLRLLPSFVSVVRELALLFLPVAEAAEAPVTLAQASGSPSSANCPLDLDATYDERSPIVRRGQPVEQRSQRTLEFMQEVGSILGQGGSVREKIIKAADAAAKCRVTMGSCNATVQTINQIAGVSGLGRTALEASGDQVNFMAEKVETCAGDRRCIIRSYREVYAKLHAELPGYPETWLSTLRAGDAIYVYNGNGNEAGQHSAIFLSWCGTRGEACVVQGGRFSSGLWVRGDPRICIKPECMLTLARGGNGGIINPVTKIFRPD